MLDSLALTLSDLAQTKRFANCLSQFIAPGRVFCLSGPLGAGKSELARAMITNFCGPQDDIPSPTFTLVQPYLSDAGFGEMRVWAVRLAGLGSFAVVSKAHVVSEYMCGEQCVYVCVRV